MKKIISLAFVLFFATMASAIDPRAQFTLISGNANQTVKAGEFIDPMVFKGRYVESITPTILNGLELHCPDHIIMVGSEYECTLSGRVTSAALSGKYDMVFDYFDEKGDSATLLVPITVVGMESDLELLSGTPNQTLNAGESIEPIVYRYRNAKQVFVDGAPAGVSISIDESSYTFTISGTTRVSSSNRTFEYTIKVLIEDPETSALDTVYAKGKFVLNKTPGLVSFEIIENETQSVKPGDDIKPIVIKYANGIVGFDVRAVGVPVESFDFKQDPDNRTITVTNKVPENYLDGSIKLKVLGMKSDGTVDTVVAVIHVTGNIDYPKMLILENAEQTVAPGDSIKPIVLRYLNITEAPQAPNVVSGFNAKLNQKDQTITITGMIPKYTRDTTFQMLFIAIGENGSDTARVTLNIVHKPVKTTVTLVSEDTVYVTAGDSIEPLVFQHENAMSVSVTNRPKYSSFSIETDTITNQSFVSATIGEAAAIGKYPVMFIAKGLDNDDTAHVTLVVMKKPVLTLISGKLEQTVTLGDSIEPLVFKYENLTGARAEDIPKGVTMVPDQDAKTLTVYGKAEATNFYGDYVFTVDAKCYNLHTTVEGKITIVAPQSSSSSVASSSSVPSSSSVASSSSVPSSSSVASSSSVPSSSSVASSSSVPSSSSVASSSSVPSSSSVTSSSSVKSSSSSAVSSSSMKPASSSVKSSSSAASSSSKNVKVSSSSDKPTNVAAAPAATPFEVTLEGRMLRIGGTEWVSVEVFDMQGRPVANLKQVKSAVSLESLRQGSYIVRIRSRTNSQVRQVLLK